jgi:DNA-binding NarL/FixJ family response regulator
MYYSTQRAINQPVRVFIVEDDVNTLNRLCEQFQSDKRTELVGTAVDVGQAKKMLSTVFCDIALVDLGLPDASGLEVIRHIDQMHPTTESLVLSMFGEASYVLEAVRAGASGYLLKGESNANHLVDEVIAVSRGSAPISPSLARHILQAVRSEKAPQKQMHSPMELTKENYDLSARECELLKLVSQGFVVKEIGKKLFLSPHTVTTHFKNVYKKLQVKTRGEAIFKARTCGLI